jgi:hypothetical protein
VTVLAFDTETKGLDWWDPTQQAFLVSWATDGQPAGECSLIPSMEPGHEWDEFEGALERADTVVCHNLPFDVHQLREATGIDLLASGKQLVDTAILAQIALPERRFMTGGGYRLKDLSEALVIENAKESVDALVEAAKKHGINLKTTGGYYALWLVERELVEHYAREDARITLAL